MPVTFSLFPQVNHELQVEFTFREKKYFARYQHFNISGGRENYKLHVSGYSGNGTDALSAHSGMPFSTKDRDNDFYARLSCAEQCQGAWWYKDCYMSNLNGVWGSDNDRGMHWGPITIEGDDASYTEMKFRPLVN